MVRVPTSDGWLFQHFLDVQLVGGHQYSANLLHSHDTSTRATMNMAVGNGVIAAGQDGACCVMKTRFSKQEGGHKAAAKGGSRSSLDSILSRMDVHAFVVNFVSFPCAAKSEQRGELRRRAGKGEGDREAGAAAVGEDMSDIKNESPRISLTTLAEVQSDLNPQDPLQKVVRFSPDMSLLLTGGTDGHVRVWEVNSPAIYCPWFVFH